MCIGINIFSNILGSFKVKSKHVFPMHNFEIKSLKLIFFCLYCMNLLLDCCNLFIFSNYNLNLSNLLVNLQVIFIGVFLNSIIIIISIFIILKINILY